VTAKSASTCPCRVLTCLFRTVIAATRERTVTA
jgi:hypothetical protein